MFFRGKFSAESSVLIWLEECRPSGSRVPVKCFKNCIPSLKSISRTKNINICYCPRAQPWPCSRCWSSWTWSACWTPSTSSSASGFRPRPSTPGTWHSQVEWSSLVVQWMLFQNKYHLNKRWNNRLQNKVNQIKIVSLDGFNLVNKYFCIT